MGKVMFWDAQLGQYSAHTSLKGLAEMLREDWFSMAETLGDVEKEKKEWENMGENKQIEMIEKYGFEVVENPDEKAIRAWETTWGEEW